MRSGCRSERSESEPSRAQTKESERDPRRAGRLSVVSLGPGDRSLLVADALEALRAAEVVVGYTTYLDLIADLIQGKGPRKRYEKGDSTMPGGHRACPGGAPGGAGFQRGRRNLRHGGLVLDLCRESGLRVVSPHEEPGEPCDFQFEVIPGVAAFNAAASLVGAPLMHDFAAISLSDHLTPWELIENDSRPSPRRTSWWPSTIHGAKPAPTCWKGAGRFFFGTDLPQRPWPSYAEPGGRANGCTSRPSTGSPSKRWTCSPLCSLGNSRTYVWDR